MGVPTMVSSPNRVQDRSHYSQISREGSVFNMNSDGVHHTHLGNMSKASNMNLDDLVKNVVCGNGELHALTNHHRHHLHPSPSSPSNYALINDGNSRKRAPGGGFEGWKDVSNGFTNPNSVSLGREMTPRGDDDHLLNSSQLLVGIDHHHSVVVSQDWPQHRQEMGVFESSFQVSSEPFFDNSSIGGVVANGGSENEFGVRMPMAMQTLTASDEQQIVFVEDKKKKKHRYASEVMEKPDEKRQRRMIKNRESAARSRARKQAYTKQLELQVSKLQEANKRLKIQQEMDMQSSSRRNVLPRYQLRRASSATF